MTIYWPRKNRWLKFLIWLSGGKLELKRPDSPKVAFVRRGANVDTGRLTDAGYLIVYGDAVTEQDVRTEGGW